MGALAFCGNCCGAESKAPFDWKSLPANGNYEVKFLCVGDEKVGKSTLLQSFQQGQFTETVEESQRDVTKEADFDERKVQVHGEELATGDDKKAERLEKYKDSSYQAIVICVAVDQQETINPAGNWIKEIREAQVDTPIILMLTKTDLAEKPKGEEAKGEEAKVEEAKVQADKNLIKLETLNVIVDSQNLRDAVDCSAKNDIKTVNEAIKRVAGRCYQFKQKTETAKAPETPGETPATDKKNETTADAQSNAPTATETAAK